MNTASPPPRDPHANLCFEVTIEVPRWGFVKRGSTDRVDFVSPIPCPFNYGAIPDYLGGEGDLLDAVVLARGWHEARASPYRHWARWVCPTAVSTMTS